MSVRTHANCMDEHTCVMLHVPCMCANVYTRVHIWMSAKYICGHVRVHVYHVHCHIYTRVSECICVSEHGYYCVGACVCHSAHTL